MHVRIYIGPGLQNIAATEIWTHVNNALLQEASNLEASFLL